MSHCAGFIGCQCLNCPLREESGRNSDGGAKLTATHKEDTKDHIFSI